MIRRIPLSVSLLMVEPFHRLPSVFAFPRKWESPITFLLGVCNHWSILSSILEEQPNGF
ncbi:hypothetical protein Desti_2097 [Desulfomonile tiedjei DSM 6799]|uniref:Uncharacterized protein n=1 Tax=Desulfomonile tiedjei (strain ATCC 49306 / DSM 6799 / DCB-1) TaxID=706587 RepID=I4C5F5_DESTA|nr:hypothetical protein Desti_2097 [Desulfomonile tiedjei DSM 6799]